MTCITRRTLLAFTTALAATPLLPAAIASAAPAPPVSLSGLPALNDALNGNIMPEDVAEIRLTNMEYAIAKKAHVFLYLLHSAPPNPFSVSNVELLTNLKMWQYLNEQGHIVIS